MSDLTPPPADQVASMKAWLWAAMQRVKKGGIRCPVCDQHAMVYRRHITAEMARVLITAYRENGVGKPFRLPALLDRIGGRGGDSAKLALWGLIAGHADSRDPDKPGTGWWTVTEAGGAFVRGERTVPYTAVVYDGRLRGLIDHPVSIHDCLRQRFDYDELMSSQDALWAATP